MPDRQPVAGRVVEQRGHGALGGGQIAAPDRDQAWHLQRIAQRQRVIGRARLLDVLLERSARPARGIPAARGSARGSCGPRPFDRIGSGWRASGGPGPRSDRACARGAASRASALRGSGAKRRPSDRRRPDRRSDGRRFGSTTSESRRPRGSTSSACSVTTRTRSAARTPCAPIRSKGRRPRDPRADPVARGSPTGLADRRGERRGARAADHALSPCNALESCLVAIWSGDLAAAERAVTALLDHSARHGLAVRHGGLAASTGPCSSRRRGGTWTGAAPHRGRRAPRGQLHPVLSSHARHAGARPGGSGAGRSALATIDEALAKCERDEERWWIAELCASGPRSFYGWEPRGRPGGRGAASAGARVGPPSGSPVDGATLRHRSRPTMARSRPAGPRA